MQALIASLSRKCGICNSRADKTCGRCHKIFYCGSPHQKFDWKIHRTVCYPAEESKNDQFGRHLVATKTIACGEKIFSESPLMFSPCGNLDIILPICLGCCRILPGKFGELGSGRALCPSCSWILCSTDCPLKRNHSEFECELFSKMNFNPALIIKLMDNERGRELVYKTYRHIQVLRLLLLKRKDPEKWKKVYNLKFNCPQNTEECILFMRKFCGLCKYEYPDDIIGHILGVARTNSIGPLGVINMEKVGMTCSLQIYEKMSKLTHSCIRNTFKTGYNGPSGSYNALFATVDIPKGGILTETYCREAVMRMGIVERREYLNIGYQFLCLCPRCSDPTELGSYSSAIKCKLLLGKGNVLCSGFYIPVKISTPEKNGDIYNHDKWQCNNEECNSIQSYSKTLVKIYNKLQTSIENEDDFDDRIELLEEYEKKEIVHENHCLLMSLRNQIVQDMMNMQCTIPFIVIYGRLLEKLARKCLTVVDLFQPGKTPDRARLLNAVAKGMEMQISSFSGEMLSIVLKKAYETREEAISIVKYVREVSRSYDELVELNRINKAMMDDIMRF